MRFAVFNEVEIRIVVLRDTAPYSFEADCQHFEGTHSLYLQGCPDMDRRQEITIRPFSEKRT
jgi:hypothetical protein